MRRVTRRYRIRRVSTRSTLRLGCLLGWVALLPPAAVIAWLGLQAIRALNAAVGQVRPFELGALFGQSLGALNLLEMFGLTAITDTIARMAEQQLATFLMILLLVLVLGSASLSTAGLLVSLAYNRLAAITGGLEVELTEE